MNHTNSIIRITVDKNIYSIYYAYNKHNTFYDLLEYFAFLYPELKICTCYIFYISQDNEKYSISRTSNIFSYENCLNKLYLAKCKVNCRHNENNYFIYRKKDLISIFEAKIKEFKKINQNKDKGFIEIEKKGSKKKEMLNSDTKKLKDDIALLKNKINAIPTKIDLLKNDGFIKENNLIEKNNLVKINKENNQFIYKTPKIIIDNNDILNKWYDVIVYINSIKDINKGWKININEQAKQRLEEFKNEDVLKIGILGNSNNGKTFLLSKLSKFNLPFVIKTEGLCIKFIKEFRQRKIALLDSVGFDTPILKSNNYLEEKEVFEEKYREHKATELFIQNYIIFNSNILIIVVGSLTLSEQKLLINIKNLLRKVKRKMFIFVIHNLKEFTSVNQVKDYINDKLLKSSSFNLLRPIVCFNFNKITGESFYERKENEEDPHIIHLIYANEDSNAGKYYNKYTLDIIENCYLSLYDYKPYDIVESIKEAFIKISEDILETSEKDEKITKESFIDDNPELIKLKNEKEIILKKFLFDEIKFNFSEKNDFVPKYNVYTKDNKIIIKVEVPGNCDIKDEVIQCDEYNIIKIKGEKKGDKEPEKPDDNIYNKREFGKFDFEIPLLKKEFNIDYQKREITQEKGIIIIECKLNNQKKIEN